MNMNTGNGKSDHIGLNSNQNHVYDENHLEPHSMTIIMDHNSMEGQLISDSNGQRKRRRTKKEMAIDRGDMGADELDHSLAFLTNLHPEYSGIQSVPPGSIAINPDGTVNVEGAMMNAEGSITGHALIGSYGDGMGGPISRSNREKPKRRRRKSSLESKPSSFQPYEWPVHYNALVHYANQYGHCNVPCKDIYECELPDMDGIYEGGTFKYIGHLGKWLARQRQLKKRTGPSRLAPEKEALLQVLVDEGKLMWEGITMVGKPQGGYSWATNYAALLQYYNQYGHCNVPLREEYRCELPELDADGQPMIYIGNLGKWLAHQRRSKKGKGKGDKQSKLQPEREFLLQQLVDEGKLLWNASALSSSIKSKAQSDVTWPQNYAALLRYAEEYNHCNVPHKSTYECDLTTINPDGSTSLVHYRGHLGNWLHNQRQSKKGNGYPLSPERESLLQKLVDEGKLRW